MSNKKPDRPRYWYCLVGPVPDNKIHPFGDGPPRMAARKAVLESTGLDPSCASGWIEEEEANEIKSIRHSKPKT